MMGMLMLGTLSCASNGAKISESDHYIIDFPSTLNDQDPVKLSQYVSDIEYIPIETKEDFLVGDILRFNASENNFYICTKPVQDVYQLSGKGEFVKKIGTRGRAKNEYVAVRSIYSNDSSVILEFAAKFNSYSVQTGELQYVCEPSELNINSFISIEFLDNGSIAIIGNNDKFYFADKEKNIIDSIKTFHRKAVQVKTVIPTANLVSINGSAPKNPASKAVVTMASNYTPKISKFKDEVRILSPFMDTVLTYGKSGIRTFMTVDYGNITEDQRYEPFVDGKYVLDANSMIETQKIILFENLAGEKYIFDKESRKTTRLAQGFTNDLEEGDPFWPMAIVGDKMYQIMSPDLFIEAASKSSSEKMKKIAASLTEESNPVIIAATLK